MELHSLDIEFSVPDAHDHPVLGPGGALQSRGQIPVDHQGMVSRGYERLWQSGEDRLTVVVDEGGLAVDRRLPPDDPPAVDLADRLVTQTDPENGTHSSERGYGFQTHAGFGRSAGPRRDDKMGETVPTDAVDRHLVVAEHVDPRARDLPQVLHQVVGEGVVVVDDEDTKVAQTRGGKTGRDARPR